MNLRMIMINHAADPGIEFLAISISKPYGRATVMPPACELNYNNFLSYKVILLLNNFV